MARVFRRDYTKKLPDGSRVQRKCPKWYIEYRDANGKIKKRAGFTDKRATEARANEIQRRVDREKAGIIDQESVDLSEQLSLRIDRHIEAYHVHLKASSVSDWHLSETTRRLNRMIEDCGLDKLSNIKAEPVQRWCNKQTTEQRPDDDKSKGMGPRTINMYVGSLRAFVRWCLEDGRMANDPLTTLKKANEQSDVRKNRRSLTEDEFVDLLAAAERRPLLDAMMIRRGTRKGKTVAKIKPLRKAQLERIGRERRLMYMTLVLTGLRRGELEALTWDDLDLDSSHDQSWLTVRACISKNGKTDSIPIRADLTEELKSWRSECGNPNDASHVFNVPKRLVGTLKRDIKAAGIDPTGIDVHSFRHTTATHLAKAGVAPRIAQSIMRHSDIRLTLGTYTDPHLLDTASALDSLPGIKHDPVDQREQATGTYDELGAPLGANKRPAMQNDSKPSKSNRCDGSEERSVQPIINAGVSNDVQDNSTKRVTRVERATFSLEG